MDPRGTKLETISFFKDLHLPAMAIGHLAVLLIPQVPCHRFRAGGVCDRQHAAGSTREDGVHVALLLSDRCDVIRRDVATSSITSHVTHLHMIAHLHILGVAIAH
jgi:hypothetical protein